METWRTGFLTLAAGLAICGCTQQTPPAPSAPQATAVSYDGTYQGTVRLVGVGAGVPAVGCATSPTMALQVKNNTFVYSQPHPKASTSTPATTTYTVTIAPNGTFSGQSELSGTMSGQVTGSHMAGTIDGIECVYSFTADRS